MDDVPGMKLPRLLPPFLVPAFPVGDEEDLPSSLTDLLVLKGELRRFQSTFRSLARECGAKGDLSLIGATFITMMYGYYPIAYPIAVQKEAMRRTGTEIGLSLKEIIVGSLGLLLR